MSSQFGYSSNSLCTTFLGVIKKPFATEDRLPLLETLLACRLIPLDKNPELQLIGIGKTLHQIAGMFVVSHIGEDITTAAGSLQVCAEQAGWEPIAPTTHEIYDDLSSEVLLLMDPSNAFNSIKRNVFLHNISIICPPLERCVGIFYYADTRLFIIGGGEVQSMEWATQGDPTIMEIYPIAIMPLVPMLLAEINQATPQRLQQVLMI